MTVRARAARLGQRVAQSRRVGVIRSVLDGSTAAGGGLLAAGLAFQTLFALLPAFLFLAGLSGLLIADPERRATLVSSLLLRFPPLAGAISDTLETVVRNQGAFSAIGLVGLAWGATGLYAAIDEGMERLFPGGRVRGLVERRVRGALSILIVIVLIGAGVAIGSAAALFAPVGVQEPEVLSALVGIAVTIAGASIFAFVVYRVVPTAPPSVGAALPPAIVAGIGIALLTQLFALLATRVVGALQVFGALTALFGALIWLNFVYQILILGGSWARYRRDEEAVSALASAAPAAETGAGGEP